MKAAMYCRVSTKDKQELTTQINYLNNYAKNNGFDIIKLYSDKISGLKKSRPDFDIMLDDINKGLIDTVLVYKLDRIGRSIVNLFELFKMFEEKGVGVICATQNIDTSTPEGKMFRNMLVVFAEYERELTVNRIYDGIANAKAQGKHCGRPKGSKDKKPRQKLGYYQRWDKLKG